MTLTATLNPPAQSGELLLRADLAHGDRVLAAITPVLRHLVANEDHAVFNDEVVARTRGMIESLAVRLLVGSDSAGPAAAHDLADRLAGHADLLAHCHALALESQTTERLAGTGIDPLLPPLLQERIGTAEADAEASALGMAVLASQARFIQGQRRMEVLPEELPADLFAAALDAMGQGAAELDDDGRATLRGQFDEARSRAALLSRLAFGLGDGFTAALDPAEAGVAIFATAVSLVTGQHRDDVVRALAAGQQARLALMLAAAGLAPGGIETTLLRLHPDVPVARHWLTAGREHALDLLGMDAGA